MLRFSLISANSVVVKSTLPLLLTGMFMRINFLYANLLGHLLPNPKGGSMFFNMSYISVYRILPLRNREQDQNI